MYLKVNNKSTQKYTDKFIESIQKCTEIFPINIL